MDCNADIFCSTSLWSHTQTPVSPVAPGNPVKPVAPGNPVKPVAPGNPVAPLTPGGPATPLGPFFPMTSEVVGSLGSSQVSLHSWEIPR